MAASAAPPPEKMEIEIAQRQHRRRWRAAATAAPRCARRPTSMAPPLPRVQPDRHHDMVRHHGRQRDGRDDHHRGGRRKAAQKRQHRQPVLPQRQRHGQHVQIRVRRPAARSARPPRSGSRTGSSGTGRAGTPRRRRRAWRSSAFSTTITWNMRGRHRNAAADRKISVAQRPPASCQSAISEASIRASDIAPGRRPRPRPRRCRPPAAPPA